MQATQKQKKLMKKLDIEFDSKITQSEAGDLIDQELEIRAQIEDLSYYSGEHDSLDYIGPDLSDWDREDN